MFINCHHCSIDRCLSFCIFLLAIVLSVLRFTDSDYPFGIFWPLCCLFFFDLRILITPLVSFDHCVVCSSLYGFWLHFWYLQTLLTKLKLSYNLVFSGGSCGSIISFMRMFYKSLFFLLFFFFSPLCCLFFFALRILITTFGIFKLFLSLLFLYSHLFCLNVMFYYCYLYLFTDVQHDVHVRWCLCRLKVTQCRHGSRILR